MLDEVRVISLCNYLSGPLASRLMADLGAEVIKVENPDKGDAYRYLQHTYDHDVPDDLTYRFLQYNRGKRSIALDLKSDRGKDIFKQLAAESDVVIENLRPGTPDSLGIGYEDIAAVNEDIVYCSISGYGETGPYRERAALDTLIQAVSGLVDQNSADAGDPALTGIYIADIIGGMYATISILAGLIARSTGDRGTHIDVAMLDGLVSLLNHEAAEYSARGTAPPRIRGSVVPQGVFQTADGAIALSVLDRNWPRFCDLLDLSEWSDANDFDTSKRRQEEESRIEDKVEESLMDRSTDFWMDLFLEHDLLAAPVNSVDEVFENEQVAHRGLVKESVMDGIGPFIQLAYPALFSNYSPSAGGVPRLGEHTAEILSDNGYSEEDISDLYDAGVVTDFRRT